VKIAPGRSTALVDAVVAGRAPDGLELRLFVPLPPGERGERPITVDQTNVSVVVGERAVVKWMRTPGDARAPRLLAHLAATGFTRMPAPHAAAFRDGNLVALVTAFLPGAQDGWDWCTDAVLSWLDGGPPADFAADLGTLAADLHAALATPADPSRPPAPSPNPPSAASLSPNPPPTRPSPAPPSAAPVSAAPPSAAPPSAAPPSAASPSAAPLSAGPLSAAPLSAAPPFAAAGIVAEALECAGEDDDGAWVRSIGAAISADISLLSGYRSQAPGLHLHGDLHVGQILRWRDGYAVTDFDGNPTVDSRPEPVARDLAQLRTSVLHVAEIANRRTEGRHRPALLDWGRRAADDLLTAYRAGLAAHGFAHLLDEKLLRPFEVEQECRELIYAARFLPRWRYAPLGVLRSWYG
jgi:maltokinase